ncbi:MAG: O-antigen ligase family protein [bacterium]|nr:O-antigen ligase family protein [bacterium]
MSEASHAAVVSKTRDNRIVARGGLSGVIAVSAVIVYLAGIALPGTGEAPLVALALAAIVCARDRRTLYAAIPWRPLGLFLAATALSTATSIDVSRSLRLIPSLLPGLLLLFLISAPSFGVRGLRITCIALSAIVLGLAGTVSIHVLLRGGLTSSTLPLDAGTPLLIVPNDTTMLAVLAPFSACLFSMRSAGTATRVLAGVSLAGTVLTAVVAQSRTALVTLAVGLTILVLLLNRNGTRKALGLLTLLAVAVIAADGMLGFPLASKSAEYWAGNGRLQLWSAALPMFGEAPVLGTGPHTFALYSDFRWAHNLYLELLLERGLLGLAAFTWLLTAAIGAAVTVLRRATGQTRALCAGVLAALAGFATASLVELTLSRLWAVVVVFLLLGFVVQLSRRGEESDA